MGQSQGLPERLPPAVEAEFPNLRRSGCVVTSESDPRYNCVAYAAGDLTRKWDSGMMQLPGYYWPPGAQRGSGIEALVSAFEVIGYEMCQGPDLEEGYEKVALYVDRLGLWTHAAKQEEDGWWSSKLGDGIDIRHRTPQAVYNRTYGQVMYYIRRAKRGSADERTEEA